MAFIEIGLVLSILTYVSASMNCCSQDLPLLARKDVCWDSISNTTTAISLTCKVKIRFIKNFLVNEKNELKLHLSDDFEDETFENGTYCMGNFTTIVDRNLSKLRPMVIACIEQEEEIIDDRILGYTLIVSVIFLMATAAIYALLPELRDTQGKSIINFCTSLAIGLLVLVIMKLMIYYDMNWCAVRGFLAYFFLIAAFFWSNAIAIQLLLNIRRPTIVGGSSEFKYYAMYAWGIPIVLTTCMAIVNFYPGRHSKPGIGLNHCWFFTKREQWQYMYSVMSALLGINICIFLYTSIVIWRLSFSSSHIKALKYKFMMTVRLIVVLGLPWVFEMISTAFEKHIIWTILDVFNTLQGPLIFLLLVVFRGRVIKAMYKHGWLNCISSHVEKFLAVNDDEEDVVQHTDVPMNDRTIL